MDVHLSKFYTKIKAMAKTSDQSVPIIVLDVMKALSLPTSELEFFQRAMSHYEVDIADLSKEQILDIGIYESIIDQCREEIEKVMYRDTPSSVEAVNAIELLKTNSIQEKYRYYPSILDKYFTYKISNKKEFIEATMKPPTELSAAKQVGFRLSENQRFVQTYLNLSTPYNGILLYHEVGVGKTCSAISIAENYKRRISTNNKTIILASGDALSEAWRNEIYNIEKDLNNKTGVNKQCTGEEYSIEDPSTYKRETLIKIRKSKTNQYYDIMGYRAFGNLVKAEELEYTKRRLKIYNDTYSARIHFYKEKYSNRVYIIDEVQSIGPIADDTETNNIKNVLNMIARYGVNNKFILLSATPMYNVSEEIEWIINLLLINDKRAPMRNIFTNNLLNDLPLFVHKIRGYVSYARGDNPYIYPLKLYPNGTNDPNVFIPNDLNCVIRSALASTVDSIGDIGAYITQHAKSSDQKKLSDSAPTIQNIVLYKSQMSSHQYAEYNKESLNVPRSQMRVRQLSNIDYYMTPSKHTVKHILKKTGPTYTIPKENGESFFSITNLQKHSSKIANIIKLISTSTGLCFIYSHFLEYGAIPVAAALEEAGYSRFNCLKNGKIMNNQNLTDSKTAVNNFKYILITGENQNTPALLEHFNSIENKDGDQIKVVIGSGAIETGVSIFNVRQIHILDPWWHLNALKQAIGRVVRRDSHIHLPKNKRNVTIFHHVALAPVAEPIQPKLIDEHMYSVASEKYKQVAIILRLLKKNAIDCSLNKLGNIFTMDDTLHIVDSNNTNRIVPLRDIPNSMRCDFETCEYECNAMNDQPVLNEIDIHTYSKDNLDKDIIYAKEIIKSLFVDNIVLNIEYIEQTLLTFFSDAPATYLHVILIHSLERISQRKELITTDLLPAPAYLVEIKTRDTTLYVLRPTTTMDEFAPIKYRYIPDDKKRKFFYLEDIAPATDVVHNKILYVPDDLEIVMVNILRKIIFSTLLRYQIDSINILHSQAVSFSEIDTCFDTQNLVGGDNKIFITSTKASVGAIHLPLEESGKPSAFLFKNMRKHTYQRQVLKIIQKINTKPSDASSFPLRYIQDTTQKNGTINDIWDAILNVKTHTDITNCNFKWSDNTTLIADGKTYTLIDRKLLLKNTTPTAQTININIQKPDGTVELTPIFTHQITNSIFNGAFNLPTIYDIIYDEFLSVIEQHPQFSEMLQKVLESYGHTDIRDILQSVNDPFKINFKTFIGKDVSHIFDDCKKIIFSYFYSDASYNPHRFPYFYSNHYYAFISGSPLAADVPNTLKYLIIPNNTQYNIFHLQADDVHPITTASNYNKIKLNINNTFPSIKELTIHVSDGRALRREEFLKSPFFAWANDTSAKNSFKIIYNKVNTLTAAKKTTQKDELKGSTCKSAKFLKPKSEAAEFVQILFKMISSSPDILLSIYDHNEMCGLIRMLLRYLDNHNLPSLPHVDIYTRFYYKREVIMRVMNTWKQYSK